MTDSSEAVVPENAPASKPTKPRAAKALPSDRMKVEKQFDLLRAFASASAARGNAPVTIKDVADVAGVAESSPSLVTAFFLDVGLLTRVEGKYAPSPEAIKYERAVSWNHSNPAFRLAPSLRDQWFTQALVPRAAFRPMEEADAVAVLAEAADAPPERKRQIEALLEYMVICGLLVRDGTQLKAGDPDTGVVDDAPPPPVAKPSAQQARATEPAGTSKTVKLSSGGTLTLSATLDLFSLSATDRTFVFGLIDELEKYQGREPKDPQKTPSDDV